MPPRFNIPPLTRALLAIFVFLSLLNAAVRIRNGDIYLVPFRHGGNDAPYLVVTTVAWRAPWVFLTAAFVERNVFGFLIAGFTLLYGGRYLERAWSSAELAKFMAGVAVIPCILNYIIYIPFSRRVPLSQDFPPV